MTNEKMRTLICNTLNWLETPEAQTAWILHLLDAESAGDRDERERLKDQAAEAIKAHCGIMTNEEMRELIDGAVKHLVTSKAQASWILAGLIMSCKDRPELLHDLITCAVDMVDGKE